MKIFSVSHDGGKDSGVTGFWLVEIKSLFSIVVLKFNKGSREAFHNHAFNAITWWLKGGVYEEYIDGKSKPWFPSIIPKITKRNCFHRVNAFKTTYALSIRGPWKDVWQENKNGETYSLTHGRIKVNDINV